MANEKRLIDGNALKAKMRNTSRYFYIKYDIDEAPTIDAVEVVHGRWLINPDGYYPYCSECKEEPKGGGMTNYCPNCGAKMDGDKDGK